MGDGKVEVVQKSAGTSEDDVYLVYHEYDARTHTTDIVVVDAKVRSFFWLTRFVFLPTNPRPIVD